MASDSDHLHRLHSSPTYLTHVALQREEIESPNAVSYPCADAREEAGVQLPEKDRPQEFATPGGVTFEFLRCKSESVTQCLGNQDACSGRSICNSNVTNLDTMALSDDVQLEKVDDESCSLPENSAPTEVSAEVKSEVTEHSTCDPLDQISLKERQRMLLSRKNSESDRECCSDRVYPVAMKLSSCGEQDDEPRGTSRGQSSVKIKEEPLDNSDLSSCSRCVEGDFSLKMVSVKQEQRDPTFSEEEIDNMLLRDRMNLLVSQKDSEASSSRNFEHLFETVPSAINCSPISTEGAKSVSISRPKKRKKTATDSVQTALEEDAPELLQVLVNKGVLLDEIKLYGMMEIDEALDESFCEDGFSQLEAVISKLFSQRQSFIKLAPLRCTNDSRPSYCLASLFSLVEQARYLQFRNWPVEWGWCRDLQSFIFVFARHNRIVLERPEYGYATYFFELVHSLPIEWQIKRLVTAMKLTSCGRLSLIENKALMVGEDLSKGEAQVLMEYGWEPNSGLGTMLKYRDRVVHDRKNESEGSEWRSKIGKMLMDGYSGGTLIVTNIPKKVDEFIDVQCPEIKLEF